MRKISSKKDWNDFVADVEYFLGEDGNYKEGAFAVSENGDDWNGHFYTEFEKDADGFYCLNLSFKDYGHTEWENSSQFFNGLLGNYHTPFYICDTGANYSWL